MYTGDLTVREQIIEFLIANQEQLKTEANEIRDQYKRLLAKEYPEYRIDLTDQYEARLRQLLGFAVSDRLGIPIENVIIEIEKMDMEGYLEI